MPETLIVFQDKTLEYKGIFDARGLYETIQKVFKQHSFDWEEFKNSEQVYKTHKQLEMDLRPYKKLSDYAKVMIKIIIIATDLKEREIDIKGLKKKFFDGKVKIIFNGYLITDYEQAWETNAFYFLVRMLVDKYVYKGYIGRAEGELNETVDEVYDEIRSFLNMHRYY